MLGGQKWSVSRVAPEPLRITGPQEMEWNSHHLLRLICTIWFSITNSLVIVRIFQEKEETCTK